VIASASMLRSLLLLSLIAAGCSSPPPAPPVHQATGIKICEVDSSSAIVWARLTENSERVGVEGGIPDVRYVDPESGELIERRGRQNADPVVTFPEGRDVATIEGAVPGTLGEVRVRYRARGVDEWLETPWAAVDPAADFTTQLRLAGLSSATHFDIAVEGRSLGGQEPSSVTEGEFQTAPDADDEAKVVFTVTTGTSYKDQDAEGGGFNMYAQMSKLAPDFFVHTGDILYYDSLAKTLPLAEWHWQRMYSLPTNVAFHRKTASYFIKDDHDVFMNDSWPTKETKFMGGFTFEQGLAVFRQQVGMGDRTYRTVRWGKDLQVWMVEGRDFRSPNDMEDGPDKTIWGAEQFEWLRSTMEASDASFRVLISPTPIVGPDRVRKNDNHANAGFTYEGDQVRSFLAGLGNAVVVCGDRHWQYVSRDAETGLREYSSGPASDAHAGGFSEDQRTDEHVYLNVIGGFLAATVEREDGEPRLSMKHYSVDGDLLNEDVFTGR